MRKRKVLLFLSSPSTAFAIVLFVSSPFDVASLHFLRVRENGGGCIRPSLLFFLLSAAPFLSLGLIRKTESHPGQK